MPGKEKKVQLFRVRLAPLKIDPFIPNLKMLLPHGYPSFTVLAHKKCSEWVFVSLR